MGERYGRPEAPAEIACGSCGAPVKNAWLGPLSAVRRAVPVNEIAAELPEAESAAGPPAVARMKQSGKVGFALSNPEKVVFNYLNEPEPVKLARSRAHEQCLRVLVNPLALFLAVLLIFAGFVLNRPVASLQPLAPAPIEYVPDGLGPEVETARGIVMGYLAAKTAAEKHAFVLPGVSEADIARYLQAGGKDPVLGREDVVFSSRHSDIARHWYSFTLTSPGSLKEIRTYVSMAGTRHALHWPAYVQEKDGTAITVTADPAPGAHDLHVGVCRAATLEGKARVVLLGLDGTMLCYADLAVENSADIHSRLDYERPESATVTLTTRKDGSRAVTEWKSWGLERRENSLAASSP